MVFSRTSSNYVRTAWNCMGKEHAWLKSQNRPANFCTDQCKALPDVYFRKVLASTLFTKTKKEYFMAGETVWIWIKENWGNTQTFRCLNQWERHGHYEKSMIVSHFKRKMKCSSLFISVVSWITFGLKNFCFNSLHIGHKLYLFWKFS